MDLRQFWTSKNSWVNMAAGEATGTGGETIHAWAFFTCKHNWTRAWDNQSSGYADLQGTWYAAVRDNYENLDCSG